LLEESLHQLAALVFKDAAFDDGLGVKGVGRQVVVASLLVGGSVDDTGYLCPADGSGTVILKTNDIRHSRIAIFLI